MKCEPGPETVKKREKRTPGTVRVVIVFVALLAQLFLLTYTVEALRHNAVYLYLLLEVLGAVAVIMLVSKNYNSSYTIVWLIVMLILPVFGYLLFMLWGTTGLTHSRSKRIRETMDRGRAFLNQDPEVYAEFQRRHPDRQRIASFLRNEGFPVYRNTKCSYYPVGELQFAQLLKDMEGAEKFIFLEFFIIGDGQLWDRVHDVLRCKAAEGVEVRVLFDDFGSITKLPEAIDTELRRENIQVIRFNPVHRNILRLIINYRNHQKIAVIDSNIGYTGGTNIADEYVNLDSRLGHWKDTAVRLEGDAVWTLTVTFLQMWESESYLQSDYLSYAPTCQVAGAGFYQPFADGPTNNPNNPAEETYSQIITRAQEYVYITTPYLIIDNLMKETLCIAAKSGTDVRIVTPKIWDHWYVHMVTRSNYGDLLKAGVRIYEYTPGFIHAKMILSDDDNGIVGSINMDYRSFYLHFEDAVWICGAPVLEEIKKDLLDIFAVSQEINLTDWQARRWRVKMAQGVLRIFAPLF
ncbi:MAG: Major cardiolipin synthase ClsA [Pelotomaculum sp. PtaB.Bin104]|nr:MAG: Major cardiolipin synthase ClsA [Pelotomaculum sp. PtaB.Bin104]